MTKKLTLPETAEYLKTHDDYLILTHRRPDGDTVGSAAALCRMLRAIGKRAAVYPNPQITPKFAPYWTGLTGTGGGTLVSVDVAGPNLFPYGMEDAKVDLAIDHHGTNSGFAARTYADETHAACGEILISLCP
ncbi:MAG: DHH family phosphoesterase, partial [Oscillospiraceae bacterium]|nr:DHH family phosphoesterase [Oscillospiraceae bacterium]